MSGENSRRLGRQRMKPIGRFRTVVVIAVLLVAALQSGAVDWSSPGSTSRQYYNLGTMYSLPIVVSGEFYIQNYTDPCEAQIIISTQAQASQNLPFDGDAYVYASWEASFFSSNYIVFQIPPSPAQEIESWHPVVAGEWLPFTVTFNADGSYSALASSSFSSGTTMSCNVPNAQTINGWYIALASVTQSGTPGRVQYRNVTVNANPIGGTPAVAPSKANNVSPITDAQDQSISATTLEWSNGGLASSYDVYFGTTSSLGAGQFKGNQASTVYSLAALNPSTTYFWRIDPKNANGTTIGDVWRFTTSASAPAVVPGKALYISPLNGTQYQSSSTILNWSNGGWTTSYDVYFGTTSSLGAGQFKGNQASTVYSPAALKLNTTYFWRIDSKNANGTTTGDVWSFSTFPVPLGAVNFSSSGSGRQYYNFGTSYSLPIVVRGEYYLPTTSGINAATIRISNVQAQNISLGVDAYVYARFTANSFFGNYFFNNEIVFQIPPSAVGFGGNTQYGPWSPGQWIPFVVSFDADGSFSSAISGNTKSCNIPNTQTINAWYIALASDQASATPGLVQFRNVTVNTIAGTTPVVAPRKAYNLLPITGTLDQSASAMTLKWMNGGGATGYDVYFGTTSNLGAGQLKGTRTSTSYSPGTLNPNTTYYWRIDPTNAIGSTTGDVWRFTTLAVPLKAATPTPTNNLTSVSANATSVSWQDGGRAKSYDVYFGTTSSLGAGQFKGNQASASYSTGTLNANTTYYWRIDAKNTSGTTTGDVWKFTTAASGGGVATLTTQMLDGYRGNAVTKIAADGVAVIKITVTSSAQGTFSVNTPANQSVNLAGALSTTLGGQATDNLSFAAGTTFTFYYTAPADFGADPATTTPYSSRIVSLGGSWDSGASNISIPLTVVRPPLVLVHGIWADATTWDYFYKTLIRIMPDIIDCEVSVPSYPNYSSFNANREILRSNLLQTLSQARRNRCAVEQVDYVGHSMGGVLGRMLTTYNDGKTGKSLINKLITIHSPLLGTSATTVLLGKNPAIYQTVPGLAALALLKGFMPSAYDHLFDPAVQDLQNTSNAVNQLPATEKIVHMIGGTTPGNASYSALNSLTALVYQPGSIFKMQQDDIALTSANGWDGVVSLRSQIMSSDKNELPSARTIDQYEHTNAPKEASTVNTVISLLNSALSSDKFRTLPANADIHGVTGLGVREQGLARGAAAEDNFTVIRDRAKFRISSPAAGTVLKSGTTTGVTIATTGISPDTISLLADWKYGSSQSLGLPPWSFDLALDNSKIGNGTLFAIGVENSSNTLYWDTVPVVISTDSQIQALAINQNQIEIKAGEAYPLTVWGDFGDSQNLLYLMGQSVFPVTFTSDNENVARVSDTGMIIAVGPGTAHIKIKVNPETTVTVTVLEAASTTSDSNAGDAGAKKGCIITRLNCLPSYWSWFRGWRDWILSSAIGRALVNLYYSV